MRTFAAFHTAQAFIFERAGKVAKTHGGVHREFGRLTKGERLDEQFVVFLTQAYNLKSVADYETGPGSISPAERAAYAVETAQQLLEGISDLLQER